MFKAGQGSDMSYTMLAVSGTIPIEGHAFYNIPLTAALARMHAVPPSPATVVSATLVWVSNVSGTAPKSDIGCAKLSYLRKEDRIA